MARYAASLVRVEYEQEPHATDLEAQRETRRGREERTAQAASHSARRRREGLRAGAGAGRGGVPRARRAPQPDGDVRGDRGVGRRRPAHRLRQDPGPQNSATTSANVFGLRRTRCACCRLYVGGGVRLRAASAIPAAAGRAGGAGAEALGAGDADAPADVHARLPRRQRARRWRSAADRDGSARGVPPRGDRR